MKNFKTNTGLIKLVLIIIIAILVLSYFGINIRAVVESETAQNNLGYVAGLVSGLWNNYLKGPVLYFWNDIFIGILWDSFKGAMQNIKNGQPTSIESNAPRVDNLLQL